MRLSKAEERALKNGTSDDDRKSKRKDKERAVRSDSDKEQRSRDKEVEGPAVCVFPSPVYGFRSY